MSIARILLIPLALAGALAAGQPQIEQFDGTRYRPLGAPVSVD